MDCIYLAAGLGVRLEKKIPKQFYKILGKPIFIYSLEVLEKIDCIETIYMTFHPDFKNTYLRIIEKYNISKVVLINGGETRQESVWKALQHIKNEKLLIHEAARPLITSDFINNIIRYNNKAVVPTIPIPFTVSEGDKYMTGELDRSKLHNIQLPQFFDRKTLITAHKKAQEENYTATEDSILVFRLGEKIKFISGMENNIKITTPLDLIVVENLLKGVERWEG